ncbi:hypothetical protein F2Q69_00036547 [Brassica cretica]|uniref:Uncharacterized protein n=1 Tax=Brassica cretica TaxID=69181 RepID=A0A8S9SKY8_BRACR|nr:hypothetical protein F2Q69_00036547 [Brassica cretica]
MEITDLASRAMESGSREEGEIKGTGDDAATLATEEFQLELAKTQAEGLEVIIEATEEEMGLIKATEEEMGLMNGDLMGLSTGFMGYRTLGS